MARRRWPTTPCGPGSSRTGPGSCPSRRPCSWSPRTGRRRRSRSARPPPCRWFTTSGASRTATTRSSYPAPGAPELAADVRKLLRAAGTPVQDIPDRGLDHGAYVPLVEMYPDADVPVLQVSMPTLDPQGCTRSAGSSAPLRDEGVLIVGSGFFTHNLRALSPDGPVSRSWRSSTTGARRRWPAATWTRCWTSSARRRRPAGPSPHRALRPAVRHARRRPRSTGSAST